MKMNPNRGLPGIRFNKKKTKITKNAIVKKTYLKPERMVLKQTLRDDNIYLYIAGKGHWLTNINYDALPNI